MEPQTETCKTIETSPFFDGVKINIAPWERLGMFPIKKIGRVRGHIFICHLGRKRRLQWQKLKRRVRFPKLTALFHAILDLRDEMRDRRRPADCVSREWIGGQQ